jgi:hypothetical protein
MEAKEKSRNFVVHRNNDLFDVKIEDGGVDGISECTVSRRTPVHKVVLFSKDGSLLAIEAVGEYIQLGY